MDKTSEHKRPVRSKLQDLTFHEQIVTGLLCFCLAILVGWSVYLWQQKTVSSSNATITDDQNQISNLKSDSNATNKSFSAYQNAHPATISVKAPNGQTISYPNNASNDSVIFWYGGYYAPNADAAQLLASDNVLSLSTTPAFQFLSTIPSQTLTPICGGGGPLNDLSIQVYSMSLGSPGRLSHNQYANCLVLMSNSHTQYAQEAKQIESQSETAIQAFANDVKVSSK